MKNEIEKLLKSDITAEEISRRTGLSASMIKKLRNGERRVGGISLDNAESILNYYNKMEEFKMRNEKFKKALKMVTIANEYLIDNKLERAYITLYNSRSHLLENYEEESHQGMIEYLNSQQAPINDPFVVIDRTGMEFDESVILKLSDFDSHTDLLDYVDKIYLKKVLY